MSKDDLLTQLSVIERQLQSSDEPTRDLVDALLEVARGAKLPMDERRADTQMFLEGAASVEAATWLQCGGLLHALGQGYVTEDRALAARLAQRIFELLPTHT